MWGYGILGKGPKLSSTTIPEMIPKRLFGQNEFNPENPVTNVYAGIGHFFAKTSKPVIR